MPLYTTSVIWNIPRLLVKIFSSEKILGSWEKISPRQRKNFWPPKKFRLHGKIFGAWKNTIYSMVTIAKTRALVYFLHSQMANGAKITTVIMTSRAYFQNSITHLLMNEDVSKWIREQTELAQSQQYLQLFPLPFASPPLSIIFQNSVSRNRQRPFGCFVQLIFLLLKLFNEFR